MATPLPLSAVRKTSWTGSFIPTPRNGSYWLAPTMHIRFQQRLRSRPLSVCWQTTEKPIAISSCWDNRCSRAWRRSSVTVDSRLVVARQGSAFCIYFMDHCPKDWHDLATSHDFGFDLKLRRKLIDRGIYFFPLAGKQCSISAAHTKEDVEVTLEHLSCALHEMRKHTLKDVQRTLNLIGR